MHKITQTEWEQAMCAKILKLTADELTIDFRYLDMAISTLAPTPNETLSCTATDGISLFFPSEQILRVFKDNPLFLKRAMLHSVFHCIFRHLWIRGQRDKALWDLSCDIAVEWVIDSFTKRSVRRALSGIRASLYGEFEAQHIPVTAANIYRHLLGDVAKDPERLNRFMMEFFTDDHRFWPGDPAASPSAANAGKQWEKIGRRMEQELSLRGSESASGTEAITKQIHQGKSRRSYREFLRKFTVLKEELHTSDDEFDLSYYTYGLRLYKNLPLIEPLESREVTKISEFVIVIDTSYSTSGALVTRFLEETFQIIRERDSFFRESQIRIIQCDNAVHADMVLKNEQDIRLLLDDFHLIGGGGTDFRPAFSYINDLVEKGAFQNLRGVLYFTDGKGIYPAKRPPYETAFLFLGEEDTAQVPPWAMKLILHEEDFNL